MPEHHVRATKIVSTPQRDLAFLRADFFFTLLRFAVELPRRFADVPRPVEALF